MGKKLFKQEREFEHKLFFDWLLDQVSTQNIDYLLVAGDIFDTPQVSANALKLFLEFLEELHQRNCGAVIIGGNHDSGRLLEAISIIYKEKDIHILGHLKSEEKEHFLSLKDKKGNYVALSLLPFFRNHEIYNWSKERKLSLEEEDILETLTQFFEQGQKHFQKTEEKCLGRILMAHHLFGNFEMTGSEMALNLSGIDTIPPSKLKKYFDYVALGHIHKPQVIHRTEPEVYYSGSPIAFRFSETQKKSIAVLDFKKGAYEKEVVPIPEFRQVTSIKCNLSNWEEKVTALVQERQENPEGPSPFLEVQMSLTDPIPGLVDQVRFLIEETDIKLLSFQTHFGKTDEVETKIGAQGQLPDTETLFKEFYLLKHPQSEEVPKEILNDFIELLNEDSSP